MVLWFVLLQARQVQWDRQDHWARQAPQEPPVPQDHLVRRPRTVTTAHLVCKVRLALLDLLVHQAVPVRWDRGATKAAREIRELLARMEKTVKMVCQALVVPMDAPDQLDQLVHLDRREPTELRVRRAMPATADRLVLRDHREASVLPDLMACQAKMVKTVGKVRKEKRDLMVHQDLLDNRVREVTLVQPVPEV